MKKYLQKKYIFPAAVILVMLLLIILPFILDSARAEGEIEASILSGTVSRNSISQAISGTGTLTEDEAFEIELPEGVRLKSYLVSNGQKVKAGEALAEVDKVSVMEAISTVQENLDYLEEEMNSVSTESADSYLSSPVSGTVKAVYASAGDDVQAVMLRYGALAVISTDGMMAVDISSEAKLSTGEPVSLVFSDGSEKAGSVKAALDGAVTVLIVDEGYGIGEKVEVKSGGKSLGSGELYVNSPWNVTGFTGKVSYVYQAVGNTVYNGSGLFYLSETDYSAQYELLAQEHREYEELMFELFLMYQDEVIKAPADGEISGISKDTVELLSSNGGGMIAKLLANAPDGNNEISYTNYVGIVTESGTVLMNPNPQFAEDYTVLSAVNTDVSQMTVEAAFPVGTVYVFDGAAWSTTSCSAGDILLFAADESGAYVWAVYVTRGELPVIPDKPGDGSGGDDSGDDGGDDSGDGNTGDDNTSGDEDNKDEGGGHKPDGGNDTDSEDTGSPNPGVMPSVGGFSMGGMSAVEEEFEFYPLEGTVIMSVTPLEKMRITLSIDELDILSLSVGQEALITIDALPGQSFKGSVTAINVSGNSRKYTVETELARGEKMVAGMNASVTITVGTQEDVVSIPVEALVNIGSKTFVYTGFNKGDNCLENPVEVSTGLSDGINVQVDLPEGSSYWYEYYDTPPVQFPF